MGPRPSVLALVVISAVAGLRDQSTAPRKMVHSVISWTDSTRAEPWTADPSDHRILVAHLSYRADLAAPKPLVVFSTGRNEGPPTYRDLADALADAGYVVAIVDHVGERSGQRLPNGMAVPNRLDQMEPKRDSPAFREDDAEFSRSWVRLRAQDLISTRTHLQALSAGSGNGLTGRLNDRTAAVGHSIGGITAAKACERDRQISACVNLDGLSYSVPMHMADDGTDPLITQSFLFIGKPIPRVSDAALARDHMTRAEDDAIVARFEKRFADLMATRVRGFSYRVLIEGANHMDFAGGGSGAVARIEKAYLLAFLERCLLGGAGALLDTGPTERGVSVTVFVHTAPAIQ